MTIVIRRPVGVLVGLSAAALLLSACSSGPSQAGQALIVGDTTVSVDTVQQELDNQLATQTAVQQAQQQGKLDQVGRAIVTDHVLHVLITQAAARNHLTVSDEEVDQQISQNGGAEKVAEGLGTDSADTRQAVRDLLLEADLASKYANTMRITAGVLVVSDRTAAISAAQKIAANPAALNGLVQQANAAAQSGGGQGGGSANQQFTIIDILQSVNQDAQTAAQQGQQAPAENFGPLFGAPANSVVAFQPAPAVSPAWFVALIKSRNPNGPTVSGTAATLAATNELTLAQIGVSLLQPDVNQVGVRISPRYGVWNPVGMQVVPTTDQTGGVAYPVAHPQQ